MNEETPTVQMKIENARNLVRKVSNLSRPTRDELDRLQSEVLKLYPVASSDAEKILLENANIAIEVKRENLPKPLKEIIAGIFHSRREINGALPQDPRQNILQRLEQANPGIFSRQEEDGRLQDTATEIPQPVTQIFRTDEIRPYLEPEGDAIDEAVTQTAISPDQIQRPKREKRPEPKTEVALKPKEYLNPMSIEAIIERSLEKVQFGEIRNLLHVYPLERAITWNVDDEGNVVSVESPGFRENDNIVDHVSVIFTCAGSEDYYHIKNFKFSSSERPVGFQEDDRKIPLSETAKETIRSTVNEVRRRLEQEKHEAMDLTAVIEGKIANDSLFYLNHNLPEPITFPLQKTIVWYVAEGRYVVAIENEKNIPNKFIEAGTVKAVRIDFVCQENGRPWGIVKIHPGKTDRDKIEGFLTPTVRNVNRILKGTPFQKQ